MDYMEIILKGVTDPNDRIYLTEYLIGEQIKAEKEGYTKDRFFSGCRLAYEKLAAELDKNRYFILQNVIFENDDDLQKTLKNETVNLHVFTRQKFAGFLNESDLQFIKSCIVEAMLSGTSSEPEPPAAPAATSPEPAPPSGEYPHHRIFMSAKAWDFFQILKTDFVTNELADYSYIFHKMKSDGFIYDDIKQLEFIDWLSDTFNIELNASQLKSFGVSRNDKKEKIYTSIKQGFKQK